MKSKHYYVTDVEDGAFLSWLSSELSDHEMNYTSLAKRIGATRQMISNLARKAHKPQKQTVIAICWAFGMKDDPEDIWKLVEEDWG